MFESKYLNFKKYWNFYSIQMLRYRWLNNYDIIDLSLIITNDDTKFSDDKLMLN